MNKSLVIIVILSFIYLLLMALSPNAQRVEGKFAKMEYGLVKGTAQECSIGKSEDARLHYFVQRETGKTKVEFFCFDDKE